MIRPLVMGTAIALLAAQASARDYREEIMQYVVDPCYLAMAEGKTVKGVSPAELAALVKSLNKKPIEDTVAAVNRLLRNDPGFETRKRVYDLSLDMCVRGASGGK